MDDASKIGLSIVAAALILLVGFVSYREHEKRQAAEAAAEVLDQFQQEMKRYSAKDVWVQQPPARDPRAMADAAERRRQAVELQPDERCIGGTVVRVNGNAYTQVAGMAGRPVACAGRQRLDLPR